MWREIKCHKLTYEKQWKSLEFSCPWWWWWFPELVLLHFHHEEDEMFIETTGVKRVLSFHKDYTRRDEVMVAVVLDAHTQYWSNMLYWWCPSPSLRRKPLGSQQQLFNLNCVFFRRKGGNDVEWQEWEKVFYSCPTLFLLWLNLLSAWIASGSTEVVQVWVTGLEVNWNSACVFPFYPYILLSLSPFLGCSRKSSSFSPRTWVRTSLFKFPCSSVYSQRICCSLRTPWRYYNLCTCQRVCTVDSILFALTTFTIYYYMAVWRI